MADFSIEFGFDGAPPTISAREYDPALDDPGSILSDVCAALANSGRARFLIEGFGNGAWPVDVRTDLCVAVEQVPHAIVEIRAGRASGLDLYEQGVERSLTFSPSGTTTEIHCVSYTEWQPQPSLLRISTAELLRQLVALQDRFCDLVKTMSPVLYSHPWFHRWRTAMWSALPA